MSVVAVSSTDEDNAAAVFETLNDRGIGLSTPDLLRNLLLRRATGSRRQRSPSRPTKPKRRLISSQRLRRSRTDAVASAFVD
jgi:uncharacterized protein with ParB-like and HNH nuclease domain